MWDEPATRVQDEFAAGVWDELTVGVQDIPEPTTEIGVRD